MKNNLLYVGNDCFQLIIQFNQLKQLIILCNLNRFANKNILIYNTFKFLPPIKANWRLMTAPITKHLVALECPNFGTQNITDILKIAKQLTYLDISITQLHCVNNPNKLKKIIISPHDPYDCQLVDGQILMFKHEMIIKPNFNILRQVEHVELKLVSFGLHESYDQIENYGISNIFTNMTQIKNLKITNQKSHFYEFREVMKERYVNFIEALPQLVNLEKLDIMDIELNYNEQWNDILSNMPKLNHLCMFLKGNEWNAIFPSIKNINKLELRINSIGKSILDILFNFVNIISIDLSTEIMTPRSLNFLNGITGLKALNLKHCGIKPNYIKHIIWPISLTELNLSENLLKDEGTVIICSQLPRLVNLRDLNLSDNQIGIDAIKSIKNGLKLSSLMKCDLTNNNYIKDYNHLLNQIRPGLHIKN